MSDKTKIGPWTITGQRVAYDNPWLSVEHSEVIHPDGSPGIYGVVRFKNMAIGVLPLFEDGTVPLVGQHRFSLNAYSWELPEGGGPIGSPAIESAKRELQEETGYTACAWADLGEADLSNSVTDERTVFFLAWDLVAGHAQPEPSEALAEDRISFGELLSRCLDGDIRDALTHLMTLTALARFERGTLEDGAAERIALGLGRG